MGFVRIKQFISAITSKLTSADKEFISKYLNKQEQNLFYQMDLPTQKHCLNTAYTCLELINGNPELDKKILLKSALLHDCGKKAGELKTWHRVVIVLTNKLCPNLNRYFQRKGRYMEKGTLTRAFYVQSIHSKRGANFADQLNINDAVVQLIKHHHSRYCINKMELQILQQADSLN
ncbi:MAG: HD domain-containing protein [Firmicutes bacterium]|nr:HD domain-containing protein [Bacillota bacterium]